MNRTGIETATVVFGILLTVLTAMLIESKTLAWFEHSAVRTTKDFRGRETISQQALARVIAIRKPVTDALDIPPRENPGRGPAKMQVQPVAFEIMTGIHKGRLVLARNYLFFCPSANAILRKGSRAIVEVFEQNGLITDVNILKPIVRYHWVVWSVAGFLIGLIVFLKVRGLAFAGLMLMVGAAASVVLFPLIRAGFPPVLATAIYASICLIAALGATGEFSYKGVAAVLTAIISLAAAVGFSVAASSWLKLSGISTTYSLFLKQALPPRFALDFSHLATCGIVIIILGIVLDFGISIAAAVEQLSREEPSIPFGKALEAGMRMSPDIAGTMMLTLIFAWAGVKMHSLFLPKALAVSLRELFNSEAASIELLRIFAGIVGLLTAGPAAAFISAALFSARKSRSKTPKEKRPTLRKRIILASLLLEIALTLLLAVSLARGTPKGETGRRAPLDPLQTKAGFPRFERASDYRGFAQRCLDSGYSDTAAVALWRVLDLQPEDLLSRRDLSYIYASKKWFVLAEAEIEPLLEGLSEDSLTHYIAGVTFAWRKRPEEAKRHLEKAIELNPQNEHAREALERLFGDQEDTQTK